MHDLLHEFFHTFWHLDGKFFQTLHHLLIPGKLTTEFFKGHLKRYAHPIQLFLVLGAFVFGMIASRTAKMEDNMQASIEKSRDSYKRKDFLRQFDSMRHTLIPPQYADEKMRLLSDSLMFKMIYPKGIAVDKEKLEQETNAIIDKEFNKRHPEFMKNANHVSISVGSTENKVTYSVENEPDSVHDMRLAFKDSIIEALTVFDKTAIQKRIIKKTDSLKDEQHLKDEWGDTAHSAEEGFKIGQQDAANRKLLEKLRPKIEQQKRTSSLEDAIKIKSDTNNIGAFGRTIKIPTREIYELSPDSIIEKYNVTGFWQKIGTKQAIKATQNPGDLIHFYMSKLFWATVLMLPVLAGLLSLVYWRRKRFYVEHLVFLLHFNTAAFLVLIPVLWLSKYADNLLYFYFIWLALHFIASLKGYYQQNWAKTVLKSAVIGFSYFFIASLFIGIAAVVGLILF
jgi:Protein of unknown function (DUF3667)